MKVLSITKIVMYLTCFFLFACDSNSDKRDIQSLKSKKIVDESIIDNTVIPLGRLGKGVISLAYQLELTLIPKKNSINVGL